MDASRADRHEMASLDTSIRWTDGTTASGRRFGLSLFPRQVGFRPSDRRDSNSLGWVTSVRRRRPGGTRDAERAQPTATRNATRLDDGPAMPLGTPAFSWGDQPGPPLPSFQGLKSRRAGALSSVPALTARSMSIVVVRPDPRLRSRVPPSRSGREGLGSMRCGCSFSCGILPRQGVGTRNVG